jgi:Kef-type K+ transport system membrane component KefB
MDGIEFHISALVAIPLVAVLAPLVSSLLGRFVKIPLVVFEIVLGLLIGPSVLGWVEPTDFTAKLADFGLAMLFFLAGNEIDFERIRGRALNRSILGWLISMVAGLAIGILLAPSVPAGVFIGVALTSTALGTLMPMLRDAGEMRTSFGTAVIAIGAVGEFGPLIAISLFLSGTNPGAATAVLAGFVLITGGAIYLASRGTHHRLHALITATLHTSGQFAVRLVILLLTSLVGLSIALNLDMLLGAFAAGVIAKLLLADATPHDAEIVEGKLEAVGFGFFVPVFFINTGITFDLQALLSSTQALLLLPVFLILLLVVRGSVGLLTAPRGSAAADKRAIVLFTATGLPIIVAVTTIGVESGELPAGTASALVGAGMLSVLLFPLLALGQHRKVADGAPKPPDLDPSVAEEG